MSATSHCSSWQTLSNDDKVIEVSLFFNFVNVLCDIKLFFLIAYEEIPRFCNSNIRDSQ